MKKLVVKLCVKSYGESIAAFEQDSKTVLPTCCNGMHDPKDTEQNSLGLKRSAAIFKHNLLRIIKTNSAVFCTYCFSLYLFSVVLISCILFM